MAIVVTDVGAAAMLKAYFNNVRPRGASSTAVKSWRAISSRSDGRPTAGS